MRTKTKKKHGQKNSKNSRKVRESVRYVSKCQRWERFVEQEIIIWTETVKD